MRHGRLLASALLWVPVLCATADRARTSPADTRPPNVVVIFADDLGYADIGPFRTGHDGPRPSTPHLDRMAAEGVRLTSFYAAQAVCSASRAALLTGSYPNRIGIQGALNHTAEYGLNAAETTIAELVKARGYATAIFGKWHLGHHPPFLPLRHGFDQYFGLPYSNDMWPRHPQRPNFFPALPLIEGDRVVATDPDQSRLTRQYTERAVRFIDGHRRRPFFLYVPHTMPHVPLFASDAFKGATAAGLYGDVVAEVDWSVGRILDAITRAGLEENTLVIFTSDNGPWLSYGDHAGSAGTLREGKGTAFEGGVRVPFVARWPGRIPPGTVSDVPAMTIDLLPTIAGLAGAPVPADRVIDGRDIWPLLAGDRAARPPHDSLYFYWGGALHAVRSGRWKLHLAHPYQSLERAGAGGRPGTYVTRTIEQSLFDLESDPGETTDVASRHPGVVARLLEHAERARVALGDSLTGRQGREVRPAGTLGADARAVPPRGDAPFDGIRARVDAMVASGATTSLAAAVGRDGRIVWSHAAGWADRQRRVAATPQTPYSIASISKPFTATAVMALHERGRLALDAPLSRYLGPLPRPGVSDEQRVTVARVMAHRAGFPTHYQFFYMDRPARPLPFDERLRCYGAEVDRPGSRHTYSNLGYGVLGELIARVSGATYGEFVGREVLAPLGLADTIVPDGPGDVVGAAVRYAADGEPLPFYVTDHPAASEIYSSAEDLVRFGLFHAGSPLVGQQAVIDEASRARMQRPGPGGYGLGWSVHRDRAGRAIVSHGGAMPGSSATLWVMPSEKIAVAVVANTAGTQVNQIASEAVKTLLRSSESPRRTARPHAPGRSRPRGDRGDLTGAWHGELACPEPTPLTVTIAGPEDATIAIGSGPPQPLRSVGAADGTFAGRVHSPERGGAELRFALRLRDGRLAGPVQHATSLGRRGRNAVTLWVELSRAGAGQTRSRASAPQRPD